MSNTIWTPALSDAGVPIYRAIADAIAADLSSGVLREGSRLPTQRELATRLRITPLTVTRAYQEAARRGLVESTVGRGTFVRGTSAAAPDAPPDSAPLDLSKNIVAATTPVELPKRTSAGLASLLRDPDYAPVEGLLRHRAAAAAWVRRSGVEAAADRVVITPGAQQGIVSVLAAICRPGDVVLAEELTYPRFMSIAGFLQLDVRPVAIDAHGAIPDAVEKACRRGNPRAIYLIPDFQNPTGSVMPERRRADIAKIARKHSLTVIEDDVYGFLLGDGPPSIATLAPDVTAYVTGASKSVSPSLRIGLVALPQPLVEPVVSALGSMTAFTSTIAAEIFSSLVESGAADRIVANKRELVAANRAAAERALGTGLRRHAHAQSPHLWVELPAACDPRELADRARLRGIAVAPSSWFAVDRTHVPPAIRVSIGATASTPHLESAMQTIASLASDPRRGSTTVV